MSDVEKAISSRVVYEGRVVRLRIDEVRLPSGRVTTREVVEHPGAVAIVPLYDDGQVGLVRQFRYAIGQSLLELPAGTRERDEEPLQTARRELAEETGLQARRFTLLCAFYPSPGISDECLWIYLAEDLSAGATNAEEDESLEQVKLPLGEALARIDSGEIRDSKSIIGLLLTRDRLKGA